MFTLSAAYVVLTSCFCSPDRPKKMKLFHGDKWLLGVEQISIFAKMSNYSFSKQFSTMWFRISNYVYKSSVNELRGFQVTMVSSDLYDNRSSLQFLNRTCFMNYDTHTHSYTGPAFLVGLLLWKKEKPVECTVTTPTAPTVETTSRRPPLTLMSKNVPCSFLRLQLEILYFVFIYINIYIKKGVHYLKFCVYT